MSLDEHDPIWSAIPYPAFVVDEADRIVAANGAAEGCAATSLRQLRNQPLADFIGTSSVILSAIEQARREGVPVVQYDVAVGWATRAPMQMDIHAAPIDALPHHILILMHPQGMAETMDRSLSHRSAAKSVSGMASMLAHEIRNPLAGISGAAQLLEMGLADEERELTRLIVQETARIGALVERVEQFGDMGPARRQSVNIHDVLDRARRSALAGFAAHAQIQTDYDPSLPPVAGDPDQILQVFQNLLKNAGEAIPKVGGKITIQTAYRPGVKLMRPGGVSESLPLVVTIRDNGTGIPPNIQNEMFAPFVSSKVNGTGLGLALVSKIIMDHGGVVSCDSVPGRTEFLVRLPVWK